MLEWLSKDTAAVIGAITGSLSLSWNILRDLLSWIKNRPRLAVTSNTGNNGNEEDGKRCIFVEISNLGKQQTTVTTFSASHSRAGVIALLNLRKKTWYTPKILAASADGHYMWQQIESKFFMLDSGSYRSFMLDVPQDIFTSGRLTVFIKHSMSKRVIKVRVKPIV